MDENMNLQETVTEIPETTGEKEEKEEKSQNAQKGKGKKKKVSVYLPRLRGEKNQDVWVCVNGKGILIKRGERVEVDPEYEEVLRHSEQSDDLADAFLNELETKSPE